MFESLFLLPFSPPDSWQNIHPILVNFTAALIPASIASDLLGKVLRRQSFGDAAWWMLFYAALITPLTALTGWLWKRLARYSSRAAGRHYLSSSVDWQFFSRRFYHSGNLARTASFARRSSEHRLLSTGNLRSLFF